MDVFIAQVNTKWFFPPFIPYSIHLSACHPFNNLCSPTIQSYCLMLWPTQVPANWQSLPLLVLPNLKDLTTVVEQVNYHATFFVPVDHTDPISQNDSLTSLPHWSLRRTLIPRTNWKLFRQSRGAFTPRSLWFSHHHSCIRIWSRLPIKWLDLKINISLVLKLALQLPYTGLACGILIPSHPHYLCWQICPEGEPILPSPLQMISSGLVSRTPSRTPLSLW